MATTYVLTRGQVTRDPLEREPVAVELPVGWRRVWRGAVLPSDLCLNMRRFRYDRLVQWQRPPTPTIGNLTAERFDCIIRCGEPVDKACERCAAAPAFEKRYCQLCRGIIKQEIREHNQP
jgi:hypothetical protein